MPAAKTEITEIVTGLAMFGIRDLETALAAPPERFLNVVPDVWDRLQTLHRADEHRREFAAAWANGVAFLDADEGLRRRPPLRVEWRGPSRPPGDDTVPADLRIDHVYLVSCKYLSSVLANAAPARLFDHGLSERLSPSTDWYTEVAVEQHQRLFEEVRRDVVGGDALPSRVADLTPEHRTVLKEGLRTGLGAEATEAYGELAVAVGEASAARWRHQLAGRRAQERMLWRLLRMAGAPYFVLGSSRNASLRLRVMTPWDWRQAYELRRFDVWGGQAGQPRVEWRAVVRPRQGGEDRLVDGHVEVRWSHGRFGAPPEAKVYLDTAHPDVPGYVALH